MADTNSSFDDVRNTIKDQSERFIGIYSRGLEGTLHTRTLHKTGERVFLWTTRFPLKSPEEIDALQERLRFFAESGVCGFPIIEVGVDNHGIAFLLTQWKEVTSVADAASRFRSNWSLLGQMVSLLGTLHAGGMPFGEIVPDSFLIDGANKMHLCGIPAFGFPLPPTERTQNFVPPEPVDEKKLAFERDIYGLGVYAHQLFTRNPFPRPNSKNESETHLRDVLPKLLALSEEEEPQLAERLIAGMLRWEPDERLELRELAEIFRGPTLKEKVQTWFSAPKGSKARGRKFRLPEMAMGGWIVLMGGALFLLALLFVHFGTLDVGNFAPQKGAPKQAQPAADTSFQTFILDPKKRVPVATPSNKNAPDGGLQGGIVDLTRVPADLGASEKNAARSAGDSESASIVIHTDVMTPSEMAAMIFPPCVEVPGLVWFDDPAYLLKPDVTCRPFAR